MTKPRILFVDNFRNSALRWAGYLESWLDLPEAYIAAAPHDLSEITKKMEQCHYDLAVLHCPDTVNSGKKLSEGIHRVSDLTKIIWVHDGSICNIESKLEKAPVHYFLYKELKANKFGPQLLEIIRGFYPSLPNYAPIRVRVLGMD